MPCRKVYYFLAIHNTDPNVHLRQVAQGNRQGAISRTGRPHIGEVRVNLAVVFLAANPWPLQGTGLNHGRHAMLSQDGSRVVRIVQTEARPILQPGNLPLDLSDHLAALPHR
jgi:hypothetical protein